MGKAIEGGNGGRLPNFHPGQEIHAPHARYRIALSFPDTGMGTFLRISRLPNVIPDALSQVADAKVEVAAVP